ncbi:MAG: hypothetical protein P4L56_31700 [Candidatus Sulfopaludibacter sp.]|nr:hypothetical protein [Candidatus Sulfopaludibacter sp.]
MTATLGQNVQPDQTVFSVTVQSPLTTTLDDLTAALKGTPLTPATFSSVTSVQNYLNPNPPVMALNWLFQLPVPLANVKDQVATLQALTASLGKAQTPLSLSYTANGPQVSATAQVQGCGLSDLVSAARTKAQQIAGAANRKPGNISAMSFSVSTMIGPSATAPYVIPACSLGVTFGGMQQVPSAITVSASRTVNVPPDMVTIYAYVDNGAIATIDGALAALPGSGFTAANLYNFSANLQSGGLVLEWEFSMAVPFSKMKDALSALQTAASQNTAVSFWVGGTQLSPQLLAAQDCSYASLLNDAQAQARQVTAAAGVSLNDLISVSESPTATPVILQGDFSQIIPVLRVGIYDPSTVYYPTYPSQPASCTLVARYGIGQ